MSKHKIDTLILSGGGPSGVAYIGIFKALIENNIDISSEHIQKIERYIIELFKWNSVYNLTGIKGLDNNISKNI